MFSLASVILSTGGHAWWRGDMQGGGMCERGVHGWGFTWQRWACLAGRCAWQGVCMAGGHAWQAACMTREIFPLQWTERILLECILVIWFERYICMLLYLPKFTNFAVVIPFENYWLDIFQKLLSLSMSFGVQPICNLKTWNMTQSLGF